MVIRAELEPLGDPHHEIALALLPARSGLMAMVESQLILQLDGLQPGSGSISISDIPKARGPVVVLDRADNQRTVLVEIGNVAFDKRAGDVFVSEARIGLEIATILATVSPVG